MPLYNLLKDPKADPAAVKKAAADLQGSGLSRFFKELRPGNTDKKVYGAADASMYAQNVPKAQQADVFRYRGIDLTAAPGPSYARLGVCVHTFLTSQAKTEAFLNAPTLAALDGDAGLCARPTTSTRISSTTSLPKTKGPATPASAAPTACYVAGMRGLNAGKSYSPDANSTIRLSYGTVKSLRRPRRGALRLPDPPPPTASLEKEDQKSDEFIVPKRSWTCCRAKDYGRYADKRTGQLPVAFLTDQRHHGRQLRLARHQRARRAAGPWLSTATGKP